MMTGFDDYGFVNEVPAKEAELKDPDSEILEESVKVLLKSTQTLKPMGRGKETKPYPRRRTSQLGGEVFLIDVGKYL
jgi:hypothetical protein